MCALQNNQLQDTLCEIAKMLNVTTIDYLKKIEQSSIEKTIEAVNTLIQSKDADTDTIDFLKQKIKWRLQILKNSDSVSMNVSGSQYKRPYEWTVINLGNNKYIISVLLYVPSSIIQNEVYNKPVDIINTLRRCNIPQIGELCFYSYAYALTEVCFRVSDEEQNITGTSPYEKLSSLKLIHNEHVSYYNFYVRNYDTYIQYLIPPKQYDHKVSVAEQKIKNHELSIPDPFGMYALTYSARLNKYYLFVKIPRLE